MKIAKIIKYILFIGLVYILFPKFNNGVITFIMKFIFYMLLLVIGNAIINDSINYITKNWRKTYLRWVDEREHIKGNTLANVTRLDFIGMIFRTIHYFKFNKRRFIQEMYYIIRDNIIVYFTFVFIMFIVIWFIIFNLYFK